MNELREFNPELMDKTRLLAMTKIDLIDEEARIKLESDLPKKVSIAYVSAVSQRGLDELKDIIWQNLTSIEPV